ncbi:MAG: diaminopimelate decarboxylase [Lentisphaeria bacterium]|nr:diaminopimelate decarboxylase [Lentisphaeria bacterium]
MQTEQLLTLAEHFGTPLFVYDGDMVIERYNDLRRFIDHPRLELQYALKANFNMALLNELKDAGCGIDAVSPGEVEYALHLGFSPDKIIYTANNMTDGEFEKVFQTGVIMNIGELSRLRKAGAAHPGMSVCLRFNPDVTDGDSAKTMTGGDLTKFGILLEDIDQVLAIVREYKMKVVGLHEHTGSGIQKPESFHAAMKALMSVATCKNFPDLEFLDFGGGFKVPYRPDEASIDYVTLGAGIAERFKAFEKEYGRELRIKFEPGKFMVAQCGTLLTRVNTLKRNRKRLIAGTDSGFPQLIRPVLYDAYHQIFNLTNPDGKEEIYDICGNICETGDRFAEQRPMPEIREGDLLGIANAGAYCYSMGGIYNLRAMPAEVVVKGGKVISFRRRDTDRDLIDNITRTTETCDMVL